MKNRVLWKVIILAFCAFTFSTTTFSLVGRFNGERKDFAVKPAPQTQQVAAPSGQEANQSQGVAAAIPAGRQSATSPRAYATTNFSGTWLLDKASLDKAKSQHLQIVDSWVNSVTWTITQDEKTISIKQKATRANYGDDMDGMTWPLLREPFNLHGAETQAGMTKRQAVWSGGTLELILNFIRENRPRNIVLTSTNSLKLSLSDDGKVLTAVLHEEVGLHRQGLSGEGTNTTLVFNKQDSAAPPKPIAEAASAQPPPPEPPIFADKEAYMKEQERVKQENENRSRTPAEGRRAKAMRESIKTECQVRGWRANRDETTAEYKRAYDACMAENAEALRKFKETECRSRGLSADPDAAPAEYKKAYDACMAEK